MFSPRWKKEAKLLYKGARKFLNYKRDLLGAEKASQIEEARATLLIAIKASDREGVKAAEKLVTQSCESALPDYRRPGAVAENIEVFFVAIVIALGIRAYFLQPFRIPTGSMQPTLNGIIGIKLPKDEFPSFAGKAWDAFVSGKKFIHQEISGPEKRYLAFDPDHSTRAWITEGQQWQFFTVTTYHFEDGSVVTLKAPRSALEEMGLTVYPPDDEHRRYYVPSNTTVSGFTTSGDLVLVDKISYNFRRPKRGEVFVFDTRGIQGIHERNDSPQGAGSHYIKRLVGVPGDQLQIAEPVLLINNEPATEKSLQKIMGREGVYGGTPSKGYQPTRNYSDHRTQYLRSDDDVLVLKRREDLLEEGFSGVDLSLYREYAAFGDNTSDSLDSRYWGSVKDYNLVGPALISLWPFTSKHWGLVK